MEKVSTLVLWTQGTPSPKRCALFLDFLPWKPICNVFSNRRQHCKGLGWWWWSWALGGSGDAYSGGGEQAYGQESTLQSWEVPLGIL